MSWYSSSWDVRIPIVLDNLVANVTAKDFQIIIPADLSEFWDAVNQTDGRDVRVTAADGVTLHTYDLNGFSFANRTLTLELQSVTPPAQSCMFVAWLYVGNSGASAASTTFAPASPRSGYVEPYVPGASSPVFTWRRAPAGAVRPQDALTITTRETLRPYLNVAASLQSLVKSRNGRRYGVEVSYFIPYLYRALADVTAGYTTANFRLVGQGTLRLQINGTALTAGNDYTATVKVSTTDNETFEAQLLVKCRRVDDGAV